jgi:gas vesicle protein
MSRTFAIIVSTLALLAAPAYAAEQKANFSVKDCKQSIEDVKEMQKAESTDPETEKTVKDIIETSEKLCADQKFGQAEVLLLAARIMLATE